MSIDRKEVEALIRLFERSDWHELRLETDGLKLVLSKDADAAAVGSEAAVAAASATEDPPEPAPEAVDGLVPITAPNLGTFYRAPKPGTPPYVEVGQSVSETTEVCLIEVMKLFTPVRAGLSGPDCQGLRRRRRDGGVRRAPFLVEPEARAAETA